MPLFKGLINILNILLLNLSSKKETSMEGFYFGIPIFFAFRPLLTNIIIIGEKLN
jgi:hypothetical protein